MSRAEKVHACFYEISRMHEKCEDSSLLWCYAMLTLKIYKD